MLEIKDKVLGEIEDLVDKLANEMVRLNSEMNQMKDVTSTGYLLRSGEFSGITSAAVEALQTKWNIKKLFDQTNP